MYTAISRCRHTVTKVISLSMFLTNAKIEPEINVNSC